MQPLFTVGHSTRSLDEFVRMLGNNEVKAVADVRAFPRSRTNPQFNADTLAAFLAVHGISYRHVPALGGKRPRSRQVARGTNAFWENAGFHNYADYAMGEAFHAALGALFEASMAERVAIMCAEALWWRCHRRIIADYLLAAGREVWHIMGPEALEPARVTPAAQPGPNGSLVYPD
jgi:uncharacterized protein (DUF488 family)